MKVLFIKLLLTFLIFNFVIKQSSAQRIYGGVGYFFSKIDKQYQNPNFRYNKKVPFSFSFYFTNLYKSKHSIGIRLYHFQRDSKAIHPTKENEYFKYGAKNILSGLLLNYRRKILNIGPKTFSVINISIGFAARDIEQKHNFPQGGLPGSLFNPIRMVYVPGIELLHKINNRIAIHAHFQYYHIFGNLEEIFPFSSVLSFEIGLSLSEKSK